MIKLQPLDTVLIQQQRNWTEVFTGFEAKNRYAIRTSDGTDIYFALEIGKNVLSRLFLKGNRPFQMSIVDADGKEKLRIVRPFRFIFHECSIFDNTNKLLGTMKWEFSFFKRIYNITDAAGMEAFRIVGPFFKPWTFNITRQGTDVGMILKRWSGMFKEIMTEEDNFAIKFPVGIDLKLKSLLLGSVFLIDFVHFERK